MPWWLPPDFIDASHLSGTMVSAKASAAVSAQETPVDEVLQVTAERQTFDRETGRYTFEGKVTATYGPTILRSDRLVLETTKGMSRGSAEGNVVVTDPAGKVFADSFTFDWRAKTGGGNNVRFEAEGSTIRASTLAVEPGRWILTGVYASPFRGSRPALHVEVDRIVIEPGRRIQAFRPEAHLFGQRIAGARRQSQSLDPKEGGIGLPNPSIDDRLRIGLRWNAQLPFSQDSGAFASFSLVQRGLPRYQAGVVFSRVSTNGSFLAEAASSDLAERFSDGYFDLVEVGSPRRESKERADSKDAITIGSYWGQRATARLDTDDRLRFDRALEAAWQVRGGQDQGVGAGGTLRLQQIRADGDPFRTRVSLEGVVGHSTVPLSPGLLGYVRLDGQGIAYEGGVFGWGRAGAGLFAQPSKEVRLGAAWMLGGEAGDPMFVTDRLFSKDAVHLRGDFDLGPTRFSLLWKYDRDRRDWYDREVYLSQVVGGVEPYLVYRHFPRTLTFGLRLRIEDFLRQLRTRDPQRPARVID